MNRIYILTLLLLMGVLASAAQEKWTLQECVDYALDNNITVQKKELDVEAAENRLNTSQNSQLPMVGASFDLGTNFGYSTLPIAGVQAFIRNNTASFSPGLAVTQNIFQGFSIRNTIAANKLGMEATIAELHSIRENISIQVVNQFMQVMFAYELRSIAQNQLELSLLQQERSKALVEGGKNAESTLYEAEALVARDELSLTEAQNSLRMALLDLAQLLNLGSGNNFDIQIPDIGDEMVTNLMLDQEEIYGIAIGTRPAINAAELRVEASRKEIDREKSAYYPSVSLRAGLGSGYNYMFQGGSDSFGSQMEGQFKQYIGMSVSVPIFNRFATRNQVRGAQINFHVQELSLLETQQTMRKDIEQAYNSAVNAYQKYLSAEASVRSTKTVMEYEVKKYEGGLSTMFIFNEAKTAYIQSQSELLKAKYEYAFARKVLDYYADKPLAF